MTWEWVLQPAIALLALIVIVGANILIWVFCWGLSRGRTNTRLNNIEIQLNNPQVLSDCTEIFTEIREKLADLGGKVQTILMFMEGKEKK